jgi:type VI secretion system lysozyme-like protein
MRGLFDRLERGARELDEGRSIAAHLRVLFGTREGAAATARDLGRPDLTDLVHTWPDGVRAIERALRALIEHYEPRLDGVTVRAVASIDPLSLAFQVRGHARRDGARAYRFLTEIDALGRCTVR